MSKFEKNCNKKCRNWESSGDGNVGIFGKCCRTCMKQVRCKDNPDDFYCPDGINEESRG